MRPTHLHTLALLILIALISTSHSFKRLRRDQLIPPKGSETETLGDIDTTTINSPSTIKDLPDHHHEEPSNPIHPLDFHFAPGDIAMNHFLDNDLWVHSVEGPGSRSKIQSGLSLIGSPWYVPRLWNLSNSEDLPFDHSGLYARDSLVYTSGLNLHGLNGNIRAPRPQLSPLPIVEIQWERGPHAGNAFQMNFERLMTDQVYMGLHLQSRGVDSLGDWSYQNSTHQPYVNSLGRDSSQIPFTGRKLAQEQLLLTPWIDVKLQDAHLRYYANFLHIDNQEPASYEVYPDPTLPYTKNIYRGEIAEVLNKESNHNLEFTSAKLWGRHLESRYSFSQRRVRYSQLPQWMLYNKSGSLKDIDLPLETTRIEDLQHLELQSYQADLESNRTWADLALPNIQFQAELRQVQDHTQEPFRANQLSRLQEDKQLTMLHWQTSEAQVQLGIQRFGMLRKREHYFSAYHFEANPTWASTDSAWGYFDFNIQTSQFAQASSLEEREIFNRNRLWYTEPTLGVTQIQRHQIQSSWGLQSKVYGMELDASYRHEDLTHPNAPFWLITRQLGDSLPAQFALKSHVFDQGQHQQIRWGGTLRLGNWTTGLHQIRALENTLESSGAQYQALHLPQTLYQGHIHWKRILLTRQNLGLSCRWDWTWVGPRETWGQSAENQSIIGQDFQGEDISRTSPYAEQIQLPHYLALDFEARMKISTFELFYKINNFNHDIYHTESGYTPAGLQFRWGVVWSFEG